MTALPARLIVILGPTASGKSALAIELAKRLNGEILVCDSTQVYRHFDIGTAKVLPRDQGGIPHHLVDLVEPDEVFTAGDYRRHALLALDDLRCRSKLPILAAGTGLYLRALLEGLADAPTRSEELRDRLRAKQRGPVHLHKILARLDPASAARIAPRDAQKIIRAIEMRILAGKPVAEIFRASRAAARGEVREKDRREVRNNALEGYAITKIGLAPPRPALYARIDARVNEMLAAGWLDEVRALVSSGVRESLKMFAAFPPTPSRSSSSATPTCAPTSKAASRSPPQSQISNNPRAASPSASSPGSVASQMSTGSPPSAMPTKPSPPRCGSQAGKRTSGAKAHFVVGCICRGLNRGLQRSNRNANPLPPFTAD